MVHQNKNSAPKLKTQDALGRKPKKQNGQFKKIFLYINLYYIQLFNEYHEFLHEY